MLTDKLKQDVERLREAHKSRHGEKICDDIVILAKIGQGGMGEIFKAVEIISRSNGLQEKVIEEMLKLSRVEDDLYIAKLDLEAKDGRIEFQYEVPALRAIVRSLEQELALQESDENRGRVNNIDDIDRVKKNIGVKEPQFRVVAAKHLAKIRLAEQAHLGHRYKREMGIQASLPPHTNIVSVYRTIETEESLWSISEFVDGISMRELMDSQKREVADGHRRLQPIPTLIIGYYLSHALEHLNWHLVTHNDLKPSNLMISYDGTVKLLDFGIATGKERLHLSDEEKTLTIPAGTMYYRSPEHVRLYNEFSKDPSEATVKRSDRRDIRSDIFVLGIILYEALTGEKPFYDPTGSKILIDGKIMNARPAPLKKYVEGEHFPRHAYRDVQALVSRCLKKKREKRYQNPLEIAENIEHILKKHFNTATPYYQQRLREYVASTKSNKIAQSGVEETGIA